jgi:SNF2 family DNA or RNA helicase
LRQDVEQLAATPWRTLIIDEAQSIKNPASRVAQAAFRLQAEFRLALTGTPIENRLGDLWSIFHSLNPGLLGGRRSFLRRYDTPIARQQPASNERLKRRVAPFLLRRTKDQVLTDLPEKNESVIYVELSAQERSIYDSVRAATQADIVSNLAPQHVTLGVLEALMRLRQAACHPGLLPGYTDLRGQPSTKIEILRQKLVELAAEGHKALVFSQWSSMLDLMEPHLQSAGLRCLRLDGRTRDRAGVVRDFQGDDDAPSQADVLLATLKVGGVGLNLTAADYVFIVDPWWNGAAERQASDRAHRIGQTRPVFVHRLVAVQTIEERVLAMAQGKLALAEAITGEQVAASLSRDDLLHLLDQ